MSTFRRISLLLPSLLLLLVPASTGPVLAQPSWPSSASAQLPAAPAEWDVAPAHVSVVDGTAVLDRDGESDTSFENVPVIAGDRIRTDRGRVEILFADGGAMTLDEFTSIEFADENLLRLRGGRIRVALARPSTADSYGADAGIYRVDTPASSSELRMPGEYRLTFATVRGVPELELAALRGSAELINERGRSLVRAGTRAVASALQAPTRPYAFNSAATDAFDRWTEDVRNERLGIHSSQYLPADLRMYGGSFDRYGSWGFEQGPGWVWYPRVDVGWQPYHHGRWSFVAAFGWTWVGGDRWSWPTHHYGRWGQSSSRWYWIPDRRWSPAWVSWAYAPDYVSWCALPYGGRPGLSINVGIGWNTLSSRHFVHNVYVPRYVADARTWRSSAFVVRDRAPEWRGRDGRADRPPQSRPAISGPGRRVATGYAVPRSGTGRGIDAVAGAGAPARPTSSAVAPGRQAPERSAPERSQAVERNRQPGDWTSPPESRLPEARPAGTRSAGTRSPGPTARPESGRAPATPSSREAGVSRSRPTIDSRAPQPRPETRPEARPESREQQEFGRSPAASAAGSRNEPRTEPRVAPRYGGGSPGESRTSSRPPDTRSSYPQRPPSTTPSRPSAVPERPAAHERRPSAPERPSAAPERRSSAPERASSPPPQRAPSAAPERRPEGSRQTPASAPPDRGQAVRRGRGGL